MNHWYRRIIKGPRISKKVKVVLGKPYVINQKIFFFLIFKVKICENAGESVIYQKVKYERSSRNSEVNSTPTQTINYIITTAKNLKELSELDKGAQITELTELISQHRSASSLASTLTTRLNAQLDNKSSSHQYMNKSFCLPIHATSITSANSPSHSYRLMPKATPKIKMYMRERNWTFGANTSYELNRVKKNRNITGDDVGGGGNTPSFIANKLAGNFSTPNKNSGNYKRVLDKRHLYAKSKYFVKRNGTDETEAFKTTQSSSLKKSSQDSVTISIKEKSKKSVDSPVANTTLNSSNEITNNRDRIEFVDRNERDGNIQRHKSSLNNEDTAILSGISANSVLKSPDLLNPNWIPLRVRTNLIELHRNLYRNRTPLQLSSISKSESNLRQSSRSRELIPEKLLSLQNSQDNGTNV